MNKIKQNKGFTIIEVVLVLAIAALIFLMVFVALPTLQQSQRDTERKNDAGIVSAAVTNYTSSYRKPPTSGDADKLRSLVKNLAQYKTDKIKIVDTATDPVDDDIVVSTKSKCNGPDVEAGNERQLTVRVKLENGTMYCADAS